MKVWRPVIAVTALFVAACQDRDPAPPPTTSEALPATAAATAGGDALPATASASAASADLEPQAMQLADRTSVNLRGELGCAFSRDEAGDPLLFAASFVDPDARSDAAVKLDGRVVRLTTASKGGFDSLARGARFAEPGGLTVNVVRGSDTPLAEQPKIAEESPRYPATMVVSKGGRELAVDGFWECGP